MNARKPAGYPSMSPYLICKHAERLIGFLKDAFGGVLLRRFDRPEWLVDACGGRNRRRRRDDRWDA